MFANRYLQKSYTSDWIEKPPHPETGMIVVIPCFKEPAIIETLESLKACDLPPCYSEVIVLINHSEASTEEIKNYNIHTAAEVMKWISDNKAGKLSFIVLGPVELQIKWAGAGLARKRGMDNAVRRFNLLERPEGVILSLDSDTLVERNYLKAVFNHFTYNPDDVGAVISFEHIKEGLSPKHLEGIMLYEDYMQYYKNALQYCGYPFPMFTVGSAFAVRAGAYVKRGGMNRRQAGEDFYFLQNLTQLGHVGEIRSTTVHPSARLSDRVPFGTGPTLQKWMNGDEDLTKTYNFQAFTDLRKFFLVKEDLFKLSGAEFRSYIISLPGPVREFLIHDNFIFELDDLNRNCSSPASFNKRFFQKFNAFRILKYLNYVHGKYYEKAGLFSQIELLKFNLRLFS